MTVTDGKSRSIVAVKLSPPASTTMISLIQLALFG
jgi:hypothetical protein